MQGRCFVTRSVVSKKPRKKKTGGEEKKGNQKGNAEV